MKHDTQNMRFYPTESPTKKKERKTMIINQVKLTTTSEMIIQHATQQQSAP